MRDARFFAAVIGVCLMIGAAVAPAGAVQTSPPQPDRIAYGEAVPTQQTLAVYLPESPPPYPTVLTIHGGGFLDGNLLTLSPIARALQAEGYAVVNITYRLLPGSLYPAMLEDAFCALAWTLAHAEEYSLDVSELFILGESAGGYLATRLAATDDPAPFLETCAWPLRETVEFAGVVAYFPIIDFTADDFQPIGSALGLGLLEGSESLRSLLDAERRADLAALSALTDIDGDEPPFLLIHGDRDRLVPPSQSLLLRDALTAVGVPAELRLIEDADHGFAAQVRRGPGAEALEAVLEFLGSS